MTRQNNFFEGCFWFKLDNLGLALGMALKFYANVAQRFKLKVRKFQGLIHTFVEVTGEKLVIKTANFTLLYMLNDWCYY